MGRSAAPASIIDAHTNPLLPADFIVPSLTRYLLLGRCFHIGRPLYKRTQRLRVRILGSVPIQHQFALQQWVAAVATSLATPTISDAGTVRLVEQVRGSKIVDGGHGTIWIIRISVDRVALPA
jgi:hypothetical protein